jgi:hypothetical protein
MSDTSFAPVNGTYIHDAIKSALTAQLLGYRSYPLLMSVDSVMVRLVWDYYPIAHAYRLLLGQPIPVRYAPYADRIAEAERTTRDGYYAVPSVFWSRITATVQSWNPIARQPDGVQPPDDQLSAAILDALTALPTEEAIETWLATVTAWLHCCSIDEILARQVDHPWFHPIRAGADMTFQLARHMLESVEYAYWH